MFSSFRPYLQRHIIHETRKFAGSQCRPIATATPTRLLAASKKKAKKGFGKLKKKPKIKGPASALTGEKPSTRQPVDEATLKARVEEWNKHGRFQEIPEASIEIVTGPPPSIPEKEFDERIEAHLAALDVLLKESLSDSERNRLESELKMINESSSEESFWTWAELVNIIENILEEDRNITSDDKKILGDLLEKTLAVKDKDQLIQSIEKNADLSSSTKDYIMELALRHQSEDLPSLRSLVTKLGAVPNKDDREKWLAEKRFLFFSMEFSSAMIAGGPSMYPAMAAEQKIYSGTPLTGDIHDTIAPGQIVVYVKAWREKTSFVAKRVVGLAGDVVRDNRGNYLRVPEGYFWAVGDNKDGSVDSRMYGPIPLSNRRFLFDNPLNIVDDNPELLK
uniref:Peptidase S26 domain-containing protein n=1 Tax=Entomoneis paludosa TaxID=265537 RepID=A0A7S2YGD1_9STRA|mmetsp:Transcript_32029/g.66869  ORF Transcript_32029/g.66869 Transcript_32029/m.66869 type:complete len:393 (+) Transcript_32029:101-1279(+)